MPSTQWGESAAAAAASISVNTCGVGGCEAIRLAVATEAASMRCFVEQSMQRSKRYLPFWTHWLQSQQTRGATPSDDDALGGGDNSIGRCYRPSSSSSSSGMERAAIGRRRERLSAIVFSQPPTPKCKDVGGQAAAADGVAAASLLRSLSSPVGLLPDGDADVCLFRLLHDAPRVSRSIAKVMHQGLETAVPLSITPSLIQFVWVFLLEVLAPPRLDGATAASSSSAAIHCAQQECNRHNALDAFVACEWEVMEATKGTRLFASLTEDPKRAMSYCTALWFLDCASIVPPLADGARSEHDGAAVAGDAACDAFDQQQEDGVRHRVRESGLEGARRSHAGDADDCCGVPSRRQEEDASPHSATISSSSYDALLALLRSPAASNNADSRHAKWRVLDPTIALRRDTPLGDARAGLHEAYWLFLSIVTRALELLPTLQQQQCRPRVVPSANVTREHADGDVAVGDKAQDSSTLAALLTSVLHPKYTIRFSVEHGRGAITKRIQPVAVPEVGSKTLEKLNAVATRRGQGEAERRLRCLREAEAEAQRQALTCLRREKVCEESYMHRRKVQDRHARLIACRRQEQQQQHTLTFQAACEPQLQHTLAAQSLLPPTLPPAEPALLTPLAMQSTHNRPPPNHHASSTPPHTSGLHARTTTSVQQHEMARGTTSTSDRRPFAAVSRILSAYDKHREYRHRNAVWAARWEQTRWERVVRTLEPSAKVLTFFEG